MAWVESVFLSKIPGSLMFSSIAGDMAKLESIEGDAALRVVLAQFDDAWQIAFLVDELAPGEAVVFVPDAPSPLSGSLFFVTPDRMRSCDLSVTDADADADAILRRIGIGAGKRMNGLF